MSSHEKMDMERFVKGAFSPKEILSIPARVEQNEIHVQATETRDTLKAVDEWVSGYGDRFDVNECWNRFMEYSPFYKTLKVSDPGPYFYAGVNLRVVFEYRYYLYNGLSASMFSKSVVKDLTKTCRVLSSNQRDAYAMFVKDFSVASEDVSGEIDELFLALWDIANC